MLRHLVWCVIIISNTVDTVCSEKHSSFSSSCSGTFDHFVSQTVGSMFCNHLANSSEYQRQLWAQSSPGSFWWFAQLPTLAGDLAPALSLAPASWCWVRVNAAMAPRSRGGKFPARGQHSSYMVALGWAGSAGLSWQLGRDVLPPLSAPLLPRLWRDWRATRPRKLLYVFELPFLFLATFLFIHVSK